MPPRASCVGAGSRSGWSVSGTARSATPRRFASTTRAACSRAARIRGGTAPRWATRRGPAMSNPLPSPEALPCEADAASTPSMTAYPARAADLGGGLVVHRALPRGERRLVGPWCFLDHFGPLAFDTGKPMDVAPHPHIGLQTVTWLLAGEVLHKDSLGSEQLIRPGQLNLMTAGRGSRPGAAAPPAARRRAPDADRRRAVPNG